MKKAFLFLVMVLITLSSLAQENNVIRFMGIPVDGKKSDMISALCQKGFEYDKTSDRLIGEFNGLPSFIIVSTNHNKVDRIIVGYGSSCDEPTIKNTYNELLQQFQSNGKYYDLENKYLSRDEDISYGITVEKKQYDAAFLYRTPELEKALSEMNSVSVEDADWMVQLKSKTSKVFQVATGMVWFKIVEDYGRYSLAIYYENLINRPHGEDL